MKVTDLYAPVQFGRAVIVGEQCVLGYPKESRLRQAQQGNRDPGAPVAIGDNSLLFNQVIVHEGTSIGADCVIEDQTRLGYGCAVGDRTRIVHGAYICDRVEIGSDAYVAGFVCDATIIGDRSTVMGDLVHEYTRPDLGWWGTDEAPPIIEPDTVVGFGAHVVGGVRLGPRCYVAAGAVVTKDVPADHIVTGINVHTPVASWTGKRLSALIDHWTKMPRHS